MDFSGYNDAPPPQTPTPVVGTPSQQQSHNAPSSSSALVYNSTNYSDADMKGRRDWNEEFQKLIEKKFSDPENELLRTRELRKLCEEFSALAKRIGTIILSELFLPNHMKTIPPVTNTIPGVAGGEKYVYLPESIFFKISLDTNNLYGGDEYIMKAAGHELKAIMECMDCRVSGLHFPLIVLVDYRGYRITAEPLLPINKNVSTIVSGSADGGHTIHNSSSAFRDRIKLVAKILNLKAHYVVSVQTTPLVAD